MKAVGSDQMVQVTKNAGDCCPAWSPDGQTLAFSRFTENEFQIYTVLVSPAPDGACKAASGLKSLCALSDGAVATLSKVGVAIPATTAETPV